MDKPHSTISVANYLLEKSWQNGRGLTPMQLIKLVYISHGWMLGLFQRPMIRDHIEAWAYGPVIPNLYKKIRSYRSQQIDEKISGPANGRNFDSQEVQILDEVFDGYGHHSGLALSRLTHKPGTPWDIVYKLGYTNATIPNDLIQDHYEQLANG